ncbi:MAG TPA: ferrous iron transport protein B [Candidatus Hydrogenedentes bacterium]|nr:ferrous iron transport protein B [Candidatus Hydrogenedentota bacterium]
MRRVCSVAAEKTKIAVVGLPNTGKSLIFNHLTRAYTVVANYPLTTVEIKRTDCLLNGRPCKIIDTPGLHCLSIHSEEELAIRDMIFEDLPDIIVQCIDANQLKQSLTLTSDLLELGVPMVVSLNAIDETARKGIWIDSTALSQLLGVPVIETIATQGRGINELKGALADVNAPVPPLRYGDVIEDAITDVEALLGDGPHSRKVALLMCMGDPFIEQSVAGRVDTERLGAMRARVKELDLRFRGDAVTAITRARSRWVERIADSVTKRQKVSPGQFSATFGHLSRHPLFGIPILLFFLALTYYLVVAVAGVIEGVLDAYLVSPVVELVSRLMPAGFWNELVAGEDYGLLTMGLFNAICTVLPILSVFFLMFGILEDIGYIPNLCVLTKRLFEKVGLSGRAVMSLALVFGCKTMATLTTKGLPRKEKLIACYLIAFCIPCSAQMGLSMGLLRRYAFWTFLTTYAALVVVEILAGLVLNKILPDEEAASFIQELPPIRLPNLRAVTVKTYYRLIWFLKEAVPIFLIAALALFLVDTIGALDAIKNLAQPVVVNWLGLPIDTVDALILCIARHEAAAGKLIMMADAGKLDAIQCMVAVFITTMFVPCFANIVAMCKRCRLRAGLGMAVAINVSAFFLAGVFYWILVFFSGTLR